VGHRRKAARIPDAIDWSGYEADLDVQFAHRLLFGKSIDEVQRYFGGTQSIGRADELLFMPRAAFQYSVFAFAAFVTSAAAKDDPDSASPFLNLLLRREERDPGSVSAIYPRLAATIDTVASRQLQIPMPLTSPSDLI
jgi:hypothetical protein